ncbi:unnamed protein product [Linum tenue]|uniref:Uncharacterized protein n=1 Tax=Linum tenue TaxID=586396 RepID=A0AAV0NYU4_9ROSI|nr:unnamed protein product [Linum tenue]
MIDYLISVGLKMQKSSIPRVWEAVLTSKILAGLDSWLVNVVECVIML